MTELEQFTRAVREGLADSRAGRLVDDDQMERHLVAIWECLSNEAANSGRLPHEHDQPDASSS